MVAFNKRSASRLVAVAVALGFVLAAFAGQAVVAEARSGSITISCEVNGPNGSTVLTGDEFSLARVATAEVSWDGDVPTLAYATCEEFASFDRDWAALDADAIRELAPQLAEYAQSNGCYERTLAADSSSVTFSGLAPGIYLVARSSIAEGNEGVTCSPMLLSVPTVEQGSVTYNLSVEPKYAWTDAPKPDSGTDTTEPSIPSSPSVLERLRGMLPQTGDQQLACLAGLIALAALAAFALRRRLVSHAVSDGSDAEPCAASDGSGVESHAASDGSDAD